MKNLSFLFLVVALALGTVACGNKDKGSSGSGGFSRDPLKVSTVETLINAQTGAIEVAGVIYQVSQQSIPVMSNAFNLAQQQQIQPVLHGGVYKFKAKITGSIAQTGYNPQYPQQQPYPQQGYGNTLNVVSAVIHR